MTTNTARRNETVADFTHVEPILDSDARVGKLEGGLG